MADPRRRKRRWVRGQAEWPRKSFTDSVEQVPCGAGSPRLDTGRLPRQPHQSLATADESRLDPRCWERRHHVRVVLAPSTAGITPQIRQNIVLLLAGSAGTG